MELIEIMLWVIASIFCFCFSGMFLIQYRKSEKLSKQFYLGLGVFMLCYGIARLIETYRRSVIASSFDDIVILWLLNRPLTGINLILRIIFYILVWGGLGFQYFNFERSIFKKNKFALTICSIVEGVLTVINTISFNYIIFYVTRIKITDSVLLLGV